MLRNALRCGTVSRRLTSSSSSDASLWSHVEAAPPDPILDITARCLADARGDVVNLGIGAYRDDAGRPHVLPAIAEAERLLYLDAPLARGAPPKSYDALPKHGCDNFLAAARRLVFGVNLAAQMCLNEFASIQALSGVGSLRLAFLFLKSIGYDTVYMADHSWPNHEPILRACGLKSPTYSYWDGPRRTFDFDACMNDIRSKLPANSIILVQACGHNPCAVDPTPEQWQAMADAAAARGHLVVFDCVYQGLSSGSMSMDGEGPRAFARHPKGPPFIVCQSFAKSMGLYGERVGAVHVVHRQMNRHDKIHYTLTDIVENIWGTPPRHGSDVATLVLDDDILRKNWLREVKRMSERLVSVRETLRAYLEAEQTKDGNDRLRHDWSHLTHQTGMFWYSALTPEQIVELREDFAIYSQTSGRMSLTGINSRNCRRVAHAIHQVTKNKTLLWPEKK